jgi:hypothetical protein
MWQLSEAVREGGIMNLLCPNCGKMLTVPEQYAGQLMKCPLCSGTFTVPALPPSGGGLDAPAPPQPAFSPAGSPDPYQLTPQAPAASAPEPAFHAAPPEPPAPPPPPAPQSGGPSLPPPPPRPVAPGDYSHHVLIPANEKILQWVTPAALLIVFILQFFPWIGVYAGSVPLTTQGAWGAAFGSFTKPKKTLDEFFPALRWTDDDVAAVNKSKGDSERVRDPRPGVSLLLLFYVLFFIPSLLITVAVAILPFLKIPFPPPVQQILPWRWAIVASLNAVLLLFLGLQILLNFGLESSISAYVTSSPEIKKLSEKEDEEFVEAKKTAVTSMVQRTIWLKIVFLLHVLATAAAALVFWVEKRGQAQPQPALELKW